VKVLVYGWYHQGNIGDDFFIEAFRHLFSNVDLFFTDHIDEKHLQDIDAVFIGGGSFLDQELNITEQALGLLKQKKIFYIGVGVEWNIHSTHIDLLSRAQLIITRSADQVKNIQKINPKAYFLPDLAYVLRDKVTYLPKKNKSVLILPNTNVIPINTDPHWKHAAWGYFKSEFSQFLDWLVESGYELNFFSLCQALEMNDVWAASELIGSMSSRNHKYLLESQASTMSEVSGLVSQYSAIITQRFHGVVLAEMTQTPYITIHHHDKLKYCYPKKGRFISYYGVNKRQLIDTFSSTIEMNFTNVLPIETNIFKIFADEVIKLV
jgi:polysaccharide pyruvyl transferase WcaK-like protein